MLTVLIEFTNDGTLFRLGASGEFVNEAKTLRAREWSNDHEQASDTEVASVLASLGARFLQPQDMRAEILRQSKGIGSVLGRVQINRLELVDSRTEWRAEVIISNGVSRTRYNMLFEPFDGRLIAMRQLPM
jgi:hypothetical protein